MATTGYRKSIVFQFEHFKLTHKEMFSVVQLRPFSFAISDSVFLLNKNLSAPMQDIFEMAMDI